MRGFQACHLPSEPGVASLSELNCLFREISPFRIVSSWVHACYCAPDLRYLHVTSHVRLSDAQGSSWHDEVVSMSS